MTSANHKRDHGRRVLLVNQTPVPKDGRVWSEITTLVQSGYSVTVVCPKEDRSEKGCREVSGVRIHSYNPPGGYYQARGLFGYAWEFAYCLVRSIWLALKLARDPGFDVIHTCNPPDTFFVLVALFKPFGKRFVYAQHDLVPELWFSRFGDRGRLGRLLHRGLLLMEAGNYRLADIVVVPNESYKAIAVRRGKLDPKDVWVVRNAPDPERVRPVVPDPALRKGWDHMVGYLGCMNPQDGLDYLLRAIAHFVHGLGRTDTLFALIGDGDIMDELHALARELEIEPYLDWVGWLTDWDLLSAYLCTADVCVAPDPKTPLNEYSSFMKIMDYMAVACPIVAFDLEETRVSAGEAALYAVPDDTVEFATKIAVLLEDDELRDRVGRIGQERIQEALSWAHQEPKLLAGYASLFSDQATAAAASRSAELSGQVSKSGVDVRLPVIGVDSIAEKEKFLDFWRLPYSPSANGQADVSFVSRETFDPRLHNAVAMLRASGPRVLARSEDGWSIFAPVRRIEGVPDGMTVVTRLVDKSGATISYVLEDLERRVFYLPFSLDEAFRGFELERYTQGRQFPPPQVLKAYYKLKPLMPAALRARGRRTLSRVQEQRATFPEWPIDLSFERLKRFVLELLLRASRSGELPFVGFWPVGKHCCLVLTHDVERSLTENPGIWRLIDAEKAAGLKSSFNVVPFKYEVPTEVLDRIREAGCEVGVHGYDHAGNLFERRDEFAKRAVEINEVGEKWGSRGFRSSSTYRNPELISTLRFDYDSSYFDSDPYEPQPGGCLSLYPYFIGDLVEIPMTMSQDHTLITVLGEPDAAIWHKKLAAIRELGAMACMNAHPDEGYIGDADKVDRYGDFLQGLSGDQTIWNPHPAELAEWWRARREVGLIAEATGVSLSADDERMCLRWARLEDQQLVFDETSKRWPA